MNIKMERKGLLKIIPDILYINLENFFRKNGFVLNLTQYNDLRTFIMNEVFKGTISYPFEYYLEYFKIHPISDRVVDKYNELVTSSLGYNRKESLEYFTVYNPETNVILKSQSKKTNVINVLKFYLLSSYYIAYKDNLICETLKKPSIYNPPIFNPKFDLLNFCYSTLFVDLLLTQNSKSILEQPTMAVLPITILTNLIDFANLCDLIYNGELKSSVDVFDAIKLNLEKILNQKSEDNDYEEIRYDQIDDPESGASILLMGGSKKLLLRENELELGKTYVKKTYNNVNYYIEESEYKSLDGNLTEYDIGQIVDGDEPNTTSIDIASIKPPTEISIKKVDVKDGQLLPTLSKKEYFEREQYSKGRDFQGLSLLLENFKLQYLNPDLKTRTSSLGVTPEQIISSVLDTILEYCKPSYHGNNNDSYVTNIVNTSDSKVADALISKIKDKV